MATQTNTYAVKIEELVNTKTSVRRRYHLQSTDSNGVVHWGGVFRSQKALNKAIRALGNK